MITAKKAKELYQNCNILTLTKRNLEKIQDIVLESCACKIAHAYIPVKLITDEVYAELISLGYNVSEEIYPDNTRRISFY